MQENTRIAEPEKHHGSSWETPESHEDDLEKGNHSPADVQEYFVQAECNNNQATSPNGYAKEICRSQSDREKDPTEESYSGPVGS